MTRRRGALLASVGIAAAVAAVLVVLAVLWQREDGPPAAPDGEPDGGAAVPRATIAEADSPVSLDVGARLAASRGATGSISVRVLDPRGQPVAQVPVRIERSAPEGWDQSTGVGGEALFAGLDPARYTVWLADARAVSTVVEVQAGSVVESELSLPSHLVQVRARLTRDGNPVSALCRWVGARVDAFGSSDADGLTTRLLRAGDYELWVMSNRPQLRALPFARLPLRVWPGAAQLDLAFAVGGAQIEVRATDGDGQALATFTAEVRIDVAGKEPLVAVFGGRDGVANTEHLPPGDWQVTATAPHTRRSPAERVTIGPATRSIAVHCVAGIAGTVDLELRCRDRWFRPPIATMPSLTVGGEVHSCRGPEQTVQGPLYRYMSLPPGSATLVCEDRRVDGCWHYLPFDPMPAVTVEVVVGRTTRLPLLVERRAKVVLIAAEASGREDPAAQLRLLAGDVPVAPLAGTPNQRFEGHLPPGSYRVVVRRGDLEREHTAVVARADIQLRLKP